MRFKQSGSTRSLFLKTFEKGSFELDKNPRIGNFGEDRHQDQLGDSSRDVNVTNDRTSRRRSRIYARIRWIESWIRQHPPRRSPSPH